LASFKILINLIKIGAGMLVNMIIGVIALNYSLIHEKFEKKVVSEN
jgi:hypothetical protein